VRRLQTAVVLDPGDFPQPPDRPSLGFPRSTSAQLIFCGEAFKESHSAARKVIFARLIRVKNGR
jgi:hypothetical protein